MEKSNNFVVLFDETLNEYLERKQFDVHVRYLVVTSQLFHNLT